MLLMSTANKINELEGYPSQIAATLLRYRKQAADTLKHVERGSYFLGMGLAQARAEVESGSTAYVVPTFDGGAIDTDPEAE